MDISQYEKPEFLVLIDTWWNVNLMVFLIYKMNEEVLIDTWWNVNIFHVLSDFKYFWVLIDTYRTDDSVRYGTDKIVIKHL